MWRSICLSKLLVISLILFSGPALAGGPSVNFYETRYEFGSVKKGEKIIHEFEFVNEGDGTLRIERLIPA